MAKITKADLKKHVKTFAKKFELVRETAETFCVNQGDLLEMACLAVVAKQHALLVGPWGCNKTRTINVFTHLCGATNGQMFRCTLDKTTPPEALLGPISPKALLEQDRFLRNLKGTICDAEYAFVGEAFSGNSATRRALHTVLNERYVENGGEKIAVKLHTAFLDSNDMPSRREDRPFYDRIVLRSEVAYLDPGNKDAFVKMRHSPKFIPAKVEPIVSLNDIRIAAQLANMITVPTIIDDSLFTLRSDLFGKNVQLSDRRWYNAYSVLRAAALLDGRTYVSPGDLWALRFVLVDYVDGQSRAVVDQLRPYKGQSLRDAEQTFLKDAQELYSEAMQGNADFKLSAAQGIRGLVDNVMDADIRDEIEAIAMKLEEAISDSNASLSISDATDDLTNDELDELIGFGSSKARVDTADVDIELDEEEEETTDEL